MVTPVAVEEGPRRNFGNAVIHRLIGSDPVRLERLLEVGEITSTLMYSCSEFSTICLRGSAVYWERRNSTRNMACATL